MSSRRGKTKRITVETTTTSGLRPYDVLVRAGLLDSVGELVAHHVPAHRYVVITDSEVSSIYGKRTLESLAAAGLETELFRFPAGEWNKTRDIWSDLTDRMLRAGLGRDSVVIALGGGVTGDLAGFVSATYMRGLPIVQVPTSLLAMVDSSVGGKTGLDTPAGKNLIGAFHQPSLVLIDPGTLSTLPGHQLAAGLAEALKHGLILDAEYFERTINDLEKIFSRDEGALERLVTRSVELKASVVARDVDESGYRRILNFGHTIAHALETVSGYELLHGEAVAIGMVAETAIGEVIGVTRQGVAERVRAVLEAARLPIDMDPDVTPEHFFEALASDKKRRAGQVRYSLIAEIGRVAGTATEGWTHEIGEETVGGVLFP